MRESDETYGEERARALRGLLRELAERIRSLDAEGRLLEDVPELMRRLGELRSELFAWEVRSTFDTPEVAESRRIVDELQSATPDFLTSDPEDDEPWRRNNPE